MGRYKTEFELFRKPQSQGEREALLLELNKVFEGGRRMLCSIFVDAGELFGDTCTFPASEILYGIESKTISQLHAVGGRVPGPTVDVSFTLHLWNDFDKDEPALRRICKEEDIIAVGITESGSEVHIMTEEGDGGDTQCTILKFSPFYAVKKGEKICLTGQQG